jgi:hypothetical protein
MLLWLASLALLHRLVTTGILLACQRLVPAFDASPDLLLGRSSLPLAVFLRWDVVWFLAVALRGDYVHEQETAFGWGWIGSMRLAGRAVVALRGGRGGGEVAVDDLLLGGVLLSWMAGVAANVVFYR